VTFQVDELVERLADAGVRLDRALTEADLKRIEKKFGFAFAADHRALLRTALPVGDSWLNWRHATAAKIRERLDQPVQGVIFAVLNKDFWLPAWPQRPDDGQAAEAVARQELASVPVLVPLLGHRYLPAAPAPAGSPVFSVDQAGVIIYGKDLLDFVTREFADGPDHDVSAESLPRIDFWSDLAR
jgi:hypothetical protein